MKILAIESSGPVASAAIWQDGVVVAEEFGEFKVTHSETLLPLTAKVVEETGTELKDIDYIAVSGGPGSFTGLRIGSATAKGLGLALEKELIHVPTLDAMAVNFAGSDKIIVPIMDARRSQVYTGVYSFVNGKLDIHMPQCAMAISELVDTINSHNDGTTVVFTGDGIAPSKAYIEENAKFPYEFAEGQDALQRAGSVAKLGAEYAAEGKTVNADDEAPEYLRPSQAERTRAEAEGK